MTGRNGYLTVDGLCYLPDPGNGDYLRAARRAGIAAVHFTVARIGDRAPEALTRMGRWKRLVREHPDVALLVEKAADVYQAQACGKLGVIFGWQDALPVEPDFDLLEAFHAVGLRILQVTYQKQNAFGSGCGEARDLGLSRAGRELVERCNRLGVALDVSHCGPRTALEVIEHSSKPVFITHAAVRAYCSHVRTKPDEVIQAIAARGGLIGILTYRVMLSDDWSRRVAMDRFVEHLDYVLKLVGEDHVGIGLDFTPGWTEQEYQEAAAAFPEIYQGCPFHKKHVDGLASVEDVPSLVRSLEAWGFSGPTITKIMGQNFLRVMEAACR